MISLVSTVYNDHKGTELFFERMAQQTLYPDEIVIVDSCSKDGTWEVLSAELARTDRPWKLVAWQERCNVAKGRNLAIAKASFPLIASTDIGCDWEPEWLAELVAPLLLSDEYEAVMGSWRVAPTSLENAWAVVEFAVLGCPELRAVPSSDASSRAIAYRKQVWMRIGGYPEDLTLAADDMVFSLLIHAHSTRIAAAPIPRCSWERPTSLHAFLKESRRNFFGAGEAGIWLDYGTLVALRLLADAAFPLLILVRIARLRPAISRARQLGVINPLLRVMQFEYGIKLYGILGFWKGWVRGFRHCRECRARLRAAKIVAMQGNRA